VNDEDRGAESAAMHRHNELLENRLIAVNHVRSAVGCCGRSAAGCAQPDG
jgi:hypothetical protein